MTVLLALSRAILAIVLLGAGAAKLSARDGTRRTLLDFGVPVGATPTLAWLLPLAELVFGVALIPASTAWWGAAGALALLVVFLAGIAWNLARGRRPDCRCFGQVHSAPIGWKVVSRNAMLLVLASFILMRPGRDAGPGLLTWTLTLSAGELVALSLGLLACAIAAFEGWLLSNLLEQNGRLLRRVDALEAQLTAGAPKVERPPVRQIKEPPLGLPLGHEAPAFALPDLNGRTISLSDLRGRGKDVLLLFMDPACGPCTALLPEIAKWRRDHGDSLTFAVLTRGAVEANRVKLAGQDVEPVLLQTGEEIGNRYQVLGTPAAVLVDLAGQVASPPAQGAEAVRRLVHRTLRPASTGRRERLALGMPATVSLGLLATVALLGAGTGATTRTEPVSAGPYTLEVEDRTGWRTWWRSDSAPVVWQEPVQAVLDATRWQPAARGADWGEVVVSGGSLALRTRIVLGRFDPKLHRMVLAAARRQRAARASWTVDAADRRAVLAFNGGQFGDRGPWGWLVRDGREEQSPGWGPLSMAVAVAADGEASFVSFDSLPALREAGLVRDAFQSYPALLVDDGRVPDRFRNPERLLDMGHRDTRLALCALRDGRVLVALTRFENLGRVFGSLPIGLTLNEMAAVMGALGCRRAVSLDGGLSAQLLVRPEQGPTRRWDGWRVVPLGIEVRPRP